MPERITILRIGNSLCRRGPEMSIDIKQFIESNQKIDEFKKTHWTGTFQDYVNIVFEKPEVTRNAYQRLYDMIISHGKEDRVDFKKKVVHYNFFDDPFDDGADAVFGLDVFLMKLVNIFNSAAKGYGPQNRVILLHGPVGSAKSTIARLLKKGLEAYTKEEAGALYSFSWICPENTDIPVFQHMKELGIREFPDPMNEEPLKLLPPDMRDNFEKEISKGRKLNHKVKISGDLNPASRYIFAELMSHYDGDWNKVIKHVKVRRLVFSEKDRVGIGTFQPKDEKNQDSTELTGDINYRKIAIFGSDSDPRAFNFDGEFNIANRGIIEFVEILKLDVAFLYDLLGASQEHKIKPKKFAQTDIDEVIIGHTNEPEYKKLQNNEFMEALRDRTIKIDVPYITKWHEETKIYKKTFTREKVRGVHIAPHTLEMAAMWSILTRLEEPKNQNISVLQKLKLYDGKSLTGFTEDNVKELRKESKREGMDGISPRYIQDKISNALVHDGEVVGCLNPFMVLNELESGLKSHSLISNEEKKKTYRELLEVVKQEYEDIVKNEVQRAISADEDAISKLCANYIDNVKAHTQKEKVKNPYTGQYEEPDERLLRSIEEKIDIPEIRKEDFRREIMNYIGALAVEGKSFDYRTNARLHKALELKLFEDQKDSIKLTTLVSNVVDKATQEKIDIVKTRLMKNFGYDDVSATDVLQYVASIFARGDSKISKEES
jgi:serine protein kinase